MNDVKQIDYGPLTCLIGVWRGDKGMDLAPEPDGTEENSYHETLIFSGAGEVTNAESQKLGAVHYRQTVQRNVTGKLIHDESGYLIWDKNAGTVTMGFTIPRGACVLAGGTCESSESAVDEMIMTVAAAHDDPDWSIVQSRFLRDNALTKEFRRTITISDTRLRYEQTTLLDIYRREFTHTDQNELTRA